ncbi:MAG: hypothetical protein ABJL99_04225 [Aliishimia sp.]
MFKASSELEMDQTDTAKSKADIETKFVKSHDQVRENFAQIAMTMTALSGYRHHSIAD